MLRAGAVCGEDLGLSAGPGCPGEPLVPRGAPLFVIPAASFSPGEGVGLGHGVVAGVVPALGDLPGRRGCGGGFGVPQTSQERLEMSVKS